MKKNIIFYLCTIILLTGCASNKEQSSSENEKQNKTVQENVEHEHNSHVSHQENVQHQHESDIQITFNSQDVIKANEEANLFVLIQKEGVPLTGAVVRFEVWQTDSQVHEYIDAVEKEDGGYNATKTFSKTGSYQVKIHIEKEQDNLHTHTEKTIEVQSN